MLSENRIFWNLCAKMTDILNYLRELKLALKRRDETIKQLIQENDSLKKKIGELLSLNGTLV